MGIPPVGRRKEFFRFCEIQIKGVIMEELIALGIATVLLIFGGAISRWIKVKSAGMVIRELDNIGRKTIDDSLDEYIDSILSSKITKK